MPTIKVKERLINTLEDLPGLIRNRNGDNLGPVLGTIFIWQEAEKFAKERLKTAWQTAADTDAIEPDDVLREGTPGEERIIIESNNFSVVVKCDKPRQTFSKDKFIVAVAKRFKLDPAQLEALAKTCMTESAPPLHKRVLEA